MVVITNIFYIHFFNVILISKKLQLQICVERWLLVF